MDNKNRWEILSGIIESPEKGSIEVPPEKTGRKTGEAETAITKLSSVDEKMATLLANAKNYSIMEIPMGAMTGDTKVNTTIKPDEIGNKVDFGR